VTGKNHQKKMVFGVFANKKAFRQQAINTVIRLLFLRVLVMKKLHWIEYECDCGFHTSKWRDDQAGNFSAENELADHMKASKKCQKQLKAYADEQITKSNLRGNFTHPLH
jgi:hypothetical protein